MSILSPMSNRELDRVLRAFLDVMNADNNDKILYIRDGTLDVVDGDDFFDITELEEVTD